MTGTNTRSSFVASLERMRRRGWLVAEWRQTASNRRARYYSLSKHGRAALLDSIEEWRAMSAAIESLIRKAVPEKTKPTRPAEEPL